MRFREYTLDIPTELDDRLKKALEEVKKRGLLPNHVTPREFLISTIFSNGLAMVEADLIKRDRSERSVLLPGEVEWPAKPSPSGSPQSGKISPKLWQPGKPATK